MQEEQVLNYLKIQKVEVAQTLKHHSNMQMVIVETEGVGTKSGTSGNNSNQCQNQPDEYKVTFYKSSIMPRRSIY